MSTDLGADAEHRLRGFDERGDDPVEVTLIGTDGELVVHADALDQRLREVGASDTEIESYVSSVPVDPKRKHDVWLNDNTALGFRVARHPVKQPDGVAIIEYQVTFD